MKLVLYALAIVACTVMVPVATLTVALFLLGVQAMGARRRARAATRQATGILAPAPRTPTPSEQLAARFASL
jgi:hypothetical protein